MDAAVERFIRRPVRAGEPLTTWALGATRQTRYDAPDQPMAGEMDPFFFVTKHKNFIPHEYPCRTQFAAERRGKRPLVEGAFAHARTWLPFGSPRVDLSGFWFRPTVLGTWAALTLHAREAGEVRLRLATCGGAVLFADGREVGWMAPYSRNLEAEGVYVVPVGPGDTRLSLWFDDLAERDARYYFQVDVLGGPPLELRLPIRAPGVVADRVEAALGSMRFERASYTGGEVALVTDAPLPVDAAVAIRVEGDFMSTERAALATTLPAGERRLPVADTEALPADFRHFHVTLEADGFAASRVFGVEIAHAARQGAAPATLDARIAEALGEIARHGEHDTVTALAALDTGAADGAAMIEASLPAILDCHDCADFILVPLLWARARYAERLPAELLPRIDEAILSYRYWMDEPGNDVQWYFSENHALLFHTAAYLAGHLMPEARFRRSGRTGREQSAVGLGRVRAWLDHFERWEMAEFNSAPYFPIDLKGLLALYALAPDADVAERARAAVGRLVEVVANSAHHGVLTAAQGRSYEHTLRAARTVELAGLARLLWGLGTTGRRVHALPQLALALRDHGLVLPDLSARASLSGDAAQEWCFAQGDGRFAALYHYKTAAFALGSAAGYRWGEWGYQETVLHARIGRAPDAQVWINHPGEVIHSGYGRPSYWGGSGTLPRVQQYRGLAVLSFEVHEGQPDFTHAWFPAADFDAARVEGRVAAARSGDGLLVVLGEGPLDPVTDGPTAGRELRQHGRRTTWIVRATRAMGDGLDGAARFATLKLEDDGGAWRVDDPVYGPVLFHRDGTVEAEGRRLDPKTWTVPGERREMAGAID